MRGINCFQTAMRRKSTVNQLLPNHYRPTGHGEALASNHYRLTAHGEALASHNPTTHPGSTCVPPSNTQHPHSPLIALLRLDLPSQAQEAFNSFWNDGIGYGSEEEDENSEDLVVEPYLDEEDLLASMKTELFNPDQLGNFPPADWIGQGQSQSPLPMKNGNEWFSETHDREWKIQNAVKLDKHLRKHFMDGHNTTPALLAKSAFPNVLVLASIQIGITERAGLPILLSQLARTKTCWQGSLL